MQSLDRSTEDQALRSIVARMLRTRRDLSPSELVELLGEHVLRGPRRPPVPGGGAPTAGVRRLTLRL